jgi:hypothetical protein
MPTDVEPWWNGYSVGRWDGDTLVIETTGFMDEGWLDVRGSPLTTTGKIIERFRRPQCRHAGARGHHRRPEGVHETVQREHPLSPGARSAADRVRLLWTRTRRITCQARRSNATICARIHDRDVWMDGDALMLAHASVWAQWDPHPSKNVPRTPDGKVDLKAPPRRTADGKIDLSGVWTPTSVKYLLNLAADLKPGELPLQPSAARVYEERIETNGKDHPGVRCLPSGIPEKLSVPDGVKIVQTPDVTLFLWDSRTIFRQVFTDGRSFPKDPQPTWMGYSIGHWEGETFVIETIGQNGKTVARHAWPPRNGIAPRRRTLYTSDDRPHQHRRDDRRSEGLHALMGRPPDMGVMPDLELNRKPSARKTARTSSTW